MQPSHTDQDATIHTPTTTHIPELTDVPAADDLDALWLDIGGSD